MATPGPPPATPIGLQIARTAKVLSRALDDALAEVDGSLPIWLILVSLKAQRHGMQRELAESVGIEGPTLTHHLNRMEADGLVVRTRDPENRRIQRVALTPAGDEVFHRYRTTVAGFDRRLRAGLPAEEVDALRSLLVRLETNATASSTKETR